MARLALALVLAATTLSSVAGADPARIGPGAALPPAAATAAATPRLAQGLEARRVKMVGNLKPGVRAKLDKPIADVLRSGQAGKAPPDYMAVARASLGSSSVLGNMSDGDIMALAFLVLMEASKSAQEDLKAIMAGVKAINAQKAAARATLAAINAAKASQKPCAKLECLDAIAASADYTKADLDAVKQALEPLPEGQRTGKLSELGELQQMRLQMFMDRQAKMTETLSNLLKKISDTSSSITSNLK
jgi:hypothetical protein